MRRWRGVVKTTPVLVHMIPPIGADGQSVQSLAGEERKEGQGTPSWASDRHVSNMQLSRIKLATWMHALTNASGGSSWEEKF